jgi:hypothetical protein
MTPGPDGGEIKSVTRNTGGNQIATGVSAPYFQVKVADAFAGGG